MYSAGTEAAIEISSFPAFNSGAISSTTRPTTCGFTHSKMTSAFFAAARLSPPSETADARFFRSAPACATVAKRFFGDTSPCFTSASISMPPIFPAPSTARRTWLDFAIRSFPFRAIGLAVRSGRPRDSPARPQRLSTRSVIASRARPPCEPCKPCKPRATKHAA